MQDRCPCCGDTDLNHSHTLSAKFLVQQEKRLRNLEERAKEQDDTQKN